MDGYGTERLVARPVRLGVIVADVTRVYTAPELPEERVYFRKGQWFIALGVRPPFELVEVSEATARAWIKFHSASSST